MLCHRTYGNGGVDCETEGERDEHDVRRGGRALRDVDARAASEQVQ